MNEIYANGRSDDLPGLLAWMRGDYVVFGGIVIKASPPGSSLCIRDQLLRIGASVVNRMPGENVDDLLVQILREMLGDQQVVGHLCIEHCQVNFAQLILI